MTIRILDPAADGNIQEGTFVGGSGDYTNVLRPDDDNTSYITTADTAGNQFHSVYVEALQPASAIASVTLTHRNRKTTGTTWTYQIGSRIGTTNALEAQSASRDTTWTTFTSAALSRPGGGAFVGSDFPGGGAGTQILLSVGSSSGGSAVGGYTTAYLNVDFTPAAGVFALFVSSWLPPLMAMASHGLNLQELASFFEGLKLYPNRRHELEHVRRALLVRPRFAF